MRIRAVVFVTYEDKRNGCCESIGIAKRAGNKTVVCRILPDDEMPYLVEKVTTDEYGVNHPVGVRERVDLITNPLAIINRTIPMVMFEGSVTFIMDRIRKHAATLSSMKEQKDLIFDVISILNPKQGKELEDIFNGLSDYKKKKFIEDCISLNYDGTLRTDNGMYIRWEAFNKDWILRDSILKVYEKYGDILHPYYIFQPKKDWGRDIPLGRDCIGYQYIMLLKQSGEKGFSVRSSGAISDESLPEKSGDNKSGRAPWSSKPIMNSCWLKTHLIVGNPLNYKCNRSILVIVYVAYIVMDIGR